MAKWIKTLLILAVIAGVVGVALSIAMIVRAVQWQEWGRVFLYLVTAIVSLEMIVLAVSKLREKENT